MTATRCLAAILAVEVVGSSRLMGRDKTGRRVEENGYVRARIIQALKRSPQSGRWLGACRAATHHGWWLNMPR